MHISIRTVMGVIVIALLAGAATGRDEDKKPELGANASLHGKRIFPKDDPWNRDISKEAVDPDSAALLASIGLNKGLHADFGTVWNGAPSGIPYVIVGKDQPKVKITFTDYVDESDAGPYPVPLDAPIEGGAKSDGDRHVLVIDRDHWMVYELYRAFLGEDGKSWKAGSAAVFDLTRRTTRPAGWTSADAAGLPIFPGLVRYDEAVEQKKIAHALRFTGQHSRRAYVAPARHFASRSNDSKLPPMGMRVRLKADYDVSKFPAEDKVILTALKKYGMILADNGSDWFLSGAPDPRWNDDNLHALSAVKGKDWDVVKMDKIVTKKSMALPNHRANAN